MAPRFFQRGTPEGQFDLRPLRDLIAKGGEHLLNGVREAELEDRAGDGGIDGLIAQIFLMPGRASPRR